MSAHIAREAARRRTFAIISHPDAGKTTLTEKLLLFGGAVQEAGAVKSRKTARTAISDFMAMEKERGISISSTVLAFDVGDHRFNLLDTPGHADFSEDTYRTLCAADAAIMVLDLAKGLEPQTLKLFRVCRDRGLPIVTFVNKCDRPGLPPLGLLDEIREVIGLDPVPLTWPVADGADFAGIVDRRDRTLVRFDRTARGATIGDEHRVPLDKAEPDGCPQDRWDAAMEEVELLDIEESTLDHEAFLAGTQTPVFFGSALANFGVRLLLDGFAEMAPPPGPHELAEPPGAPPLPVEADFAGLIFKVQANMDPRHRDRVAFVRVVSGRFERGMAATCARTQRTHQLKYAHQVFADDRQTTEEAFPGDVVGLTGATELRVGDTLSLDGKVALPPIPAFAPEVFAVARKADSSRDKQFRAGIAQLAEEGVIHVLIRPEIGEQEPILAGVGQLQLEVAEHRMANEFGAVIRLEPLSFRVARRTDADGAAALRRQRGVRMVTNRAGEHLALFESEHGLRWAIEDNPDVLLEEIGVPPRGPVTV